jgi:hypothetical protein
MKPLNYSQIVLTFMTNNLPPIIFCALLMGFIIAWLIIMRKRDRRSIQANVEARGGKVVEVLKHWGSGLGGRYQRAYDVTYTTSRGVQTSSLCLVGFRGRVFWVTDRLPGDDGPQNAAAL